YGGKPLHSRSRVNWQVQLWDEEDRAGEVSGESRFELGLLSPADWKAVWIDPELSREKGARQPASYLKKQVEIETKIGDARLYVTAHGMYDVWINGVHVDGYLLAPGNCQTAKRLQVQTYDVTALLKRGKNELLVTLGDGWYRGSVAYAMDTNTFGDDVALLLQLEVDQTVAAVSDESWLASQNGPLRTNDPMKGECYDARKEQVQDWHAVKIRDFGLENLTGTDTAPVTAHERFSAKYFLTPKGERVLDFGQNIAGFVEFRLLAYAGQKLILTHGEVLDAEGNFTTENFQNPDKKECDQRIEYLCRDGENHYRPTKCYFGFRYVKIEGDCDINSDAFIAHAIYSDMEQTGFFTCGNEEVNRLFQNALWSMKGNFVDVPTDCPTREKSGYSGDCQVFAHTAMYLMDCYPVLRRFIREQAATQFEDGCVRQIAPENRPRCFWDGGAGWCDSFEIVPWLLAKRYGDDALIAEQYEAIRKYMLFCLNRQKETREQNRTMPAELQPYFADQGIHWGEWLEPGMKGKRKERYSKKMFEEGMPEEATAFLCYGCRIVSAMAGKLGRREDEAFFREASEKARAAYRFRYVKYGRIQKSRRQCRYVRPLAMGLLEEAEQKPIADALAKRIQENGMHLNTGFLTTHELCRVLTDHGHSGTAYGLLLQETHPGWLYAVKKGATTIWESWDGIDEQGNPYNSMNHYAYGAVVGWLFDRVGGIRVEDGQILIRPYPDRRLGSVSVRYLSPFGEIRSGWRYCDSAIEYDITVPANAEADVVLPDGQTAQVEAGSWHFTTAAGQEGVYE
ncbi:MAG: glycoside hydrolase family 78 protein, partial [bacterium]|nr:glycoside hydrolase family 78 protein [bacterium]